MDEIITKVDDKIKITKVVPASEEIVFDGTMEQLDAKIQGIERNIRLNDAEQSQLSAAHSILESELVYYKGLKEQIIV